jgi:hypothetical protein
MHRPYPAGWSPAPSGFRSHGSEPVEGETKGSENKTTLRSLGCLLFKFRGLEMHAGIEIIAGLFLSPAMSAC